MSLLLPGENGYLHKCYAIHGRECPNALISGEVRMKEPYSYHFANLIDLWFMGRTFLLLPLRILYNLDGQCHQLEFGSKWGLIH